MPYPAASAEQVDAFRRDGFLVVPDAVDLNDLVKLQARCEEILERKDDLAFDWAWKEGVSREERDFTIVQSSPTLIWPGEFEHAPFRTWAIEFASALLGQQVEFWYDQFLGKPPVKGGTTYWHQDEGYWGRNLDERGITCWMPFHDVSVERGCMQFIQGGHLGGVLEHRRPDGFQSDLLACEPDESRRVATPVTAGSVTFHHGKTPHMTGPNITDEWRKVLTQHLRVVGSKGEGDHYPWKVTVDQRRAGSDALPKAPSAQSKAPSARPKAQ
jgi:phytanoyl-CoA hydroxylase